MAPKSNHTASTLSPQPTPVWTKMTLQVLKITSEKVLADI